ncbi:fluoride efflux transporter CrcB [Antrihabitans sp. YC2-6]|uniref:fluoride efflux transporter CrcB n=1 Tax=Antrihabitans sp. YC2-6 TaxID=2799498 RepID=UPI0018F5B309|nr:fluoride efflux transporter CrcB [Antrihabitans sp. YC2-6]MBJ8343540.1 fluoride efflux transporter CrcB [Antrihabitans sp. YC2-6]
MTAVLVFLGGMLGAPVRYSIDKVVQSRHDTLFPWGTLTVNVVGSAILGGLTAASLGTSWGALAGVGFCGALTTYSTFGYETMRLIELRAYGYALANVFVSLAAGLGAAILGSAATQWMVA